MKISGELPPREGPAQKAPRERRLFSCPGSLQIATAFPVLLSYNNVWKKEGAARDRRLHRQRVRAERADGLPAAALCRAPGGTAPAAKAVRPGGLGGRRLRGGGVSAGTGLSGGGPGEAGGGGAAGAAGLRRGGKAAAADSAVFRCFLRHGGLRAGPGPAGGGRRAGGERRFLHQRGRQGPGDRRGGGVPGFIAGLPGGGGPRREGASASGPDPHRRPDGGADGAVGQRQRPPGPGRSSGAGGGPRRAERSAAPGGGGAADARRAPGPGGASGTPPGRRAGSAAPADALSRGGDGGGAAADHPDGLDGDQWNPLSGTDGGAVPLGAGYGLFGAVGRPGGKGRKIWES